MYYRIDTSSRVWAPQYTPTAKQRPTSRTSTAAHAAPRAVQPEWTVVGDSIHFAAGEKARAEVEPNTLLANILGYASELERIV